MIWSLRSYRRPVVLDLINVDLDWFVTIAIAGLIASAAILPFWALR